MNEIYAQRTIDRMLSGEIPFEKDLYEEALDYLTKDEDFII